jgi:hypothetical protein
VFSYSGLGRVVTGLLDAAFHQRVDAPMKAPSVFFFTFIIPIVTVYSS